MARKQAPTPLRKNSTTVFQAAQSLQRQERQAKFLLFTGVLISVKECLAMKGSYLDRRNGLSLESRREGFPDCASPASAGALPACSGSVTQCMFHRNRLIPWGRPQPVDLERTPGGSLWRCSVGRMGCVPMAACSDAGSIHPSLVLRYRRFQAHVESCMSGKGNMVRERTTNGNYHADPYSHWTHCLQGRGIARCS
jgi:hypothetical protein